MSVSLRQLFCGSCSTVEPAVTADQVNVPSAGVLLR